MSRSVPATSYADWGKKLAQEYVTNGTLLTDAVEKLASQEGLNPEQIQRTVEAANVSTYQELLPLRGSGDVHFEKADAGEVLRRLNQPVKIAADLTDYLYDPPKRNPEVGRVLARELTSHPGIVQDLEKQAAAEAEKPLTKEGAYEYLRQLKKVAKELELERMEIARLTQEEVTKFAEIVRRMIKEGGHDVSDLYTACVQTLPGQKTAVDNLFGTIISDLEHRGYFGRRKTAEPLPASLISSNLNKMLSGGVKCEVINGKTPLTMSVKVIGALIRRWKDNDAGTNITKDEITKATDRASRVTTRFGGV